MSRVADNEQGRAGAASVPPQDSVVAALDRAVAQWPDRQWLDFLGETLTFSDVNRLALQVSNMLRSAGVKPGDTVVTVLDNSLDAIITAFGIMRLGAISVALNTAYRGEFLRHMIADTGAAVVIAEKDYAERVAAIADALPDVKILFHRGGAPETASRIEARLFDYSGFAPTPIDHVVKPGDLACLIYTSGTTGPSKGCMISHNYAINLARMNNQVYSVTDRDVMWSCLPLFHFNALAVTVLSTLLVGGRAALVPRFSVSNFWPEIVRSGASIASVLGSMAVMLAAAPDDPAMAQAFGQLRQVQGAPWPPETAVIWRDRFGIQGQIATRMYGITEATMLTSAPAHIIGPPQQSGRRNEEFEVRIVDEDDNELPPGVPGEVVCRPRRQHIMFEGYWNRPADTLKVMRNMWMHTGDVGMFDEDGWFYFLDRKKDYLRRRGENISSFEMEATFGAHPAIANVAVHAVPSEYAEDEIKVTAVLKEGAKLTERELCEWCLDKVPYFAVPRFIEFRADLPRNAVGRTLKYELRDEGCPPGTWDREQSDLVIEKR